MLIIQTQLIRSQQLLKSLFGLSEADEFRSSVIGAVGAGLSQRLNQHFLVLANQNRDFIDSLLLLALHLGIQSSHSLSSSNSGVVWSSDLVALRNANRIEGGVPVLHIKQPILVDVDHVKQVLLNHELELLQSLGSISLQNIAKLLKLLVVQVASFDSGELYLVRSQSTYLVKAVFEAAEVSHHELLEER